MDRDSNHNMIVYSIIRLYISYKEGTETFIKKQMQEELNT